MNVAIKQSPRPRAAQTRNLLCFTPSRVLSQLLPAIRLSPFLSSLPPSLCPSFSPLLLPLQLPPSQSKHGSWHYVTEVSVGTIHKNGSLIPWHKMTGSRRDPRSILIPNLGASGCSAVGEHTPEAV